MKTKLSLSIGSNGVPPDANIDHRRVPNLQTFFKRKGIVLPVTKNPRNYVARDLVTWVIPGNLPHIGIVVNRPSRDGKRPLIVHNIGHGPQLEDILFEYPITGHLYELFWSFFFWFPFLVNLVLSSLIYVSLL